MTQQPDTSTRYIHFFRRLAIALIATLALTVSVGAARAKSALALSGVFTVTYGDADPQLGGPYQTVFRLFDNLGTSTTLDLDEKLAEPYGGVQALVGRRVQVTVESPPAGTGGGPAAAAPAGGASVVTVAGIAPEALPPGAAAAPAGVPVSGQVSWVNILCKFSDPALVNIEPFPPAYFDGLFSSPGYGLTDFWDNQSYGAIEVVGATFPAVNWYTLPKTHAEYMSGVWANLNLLAQDCTDVAAKAGANFQNYDGVNLMFNADLDGYSWGGQQYIAGVGVKRMTWEAPFGYQNVGALAHEIGHGLGLRHSNNFDGDKDPYDNAWDLMSDLWNKCPNYPALDPPVSGTPGCKERGTIAYHLDYLGWILPAEKFTASPSALATITLDALDQQKIAPGDYRMARINISSSQFYTVEARKKEGPYDIRLPGDGVIIHQVVPSRNEPAWVIGGWNNNTVTTTEAIFSPGMTYSIPGKYFVHVDSATANGYVVTIGPAVAPAAPSTSAPSGLGSSHTPVFQWKPVSTANAYRLIVRLGKTVKFDQTYSASEASCAALCQVSGDTIPAGPDLADGKYSFTVTSANNYFSGKTSRARGFTVDTTAPAAPSPLAPKPGSTVRKTPALKASKVRTGVRYQIAISSTDDCSDPFLTTGELRSPSYKATGLALGAYFWCARARDAAGNWSAFGPTGAFVFAPPIPRAPKPVGPANRAKIAGGSPFFRWNPAGAGVTYQLMIASNTTWLPEIENTTLPDTGRAPLDVLPVGTYYWRVRALNAFDEPGAWSATRSVTITASP